MRRAEQQVRDLLRPLDPMRDDERAAGAPPEPGPLPVVDAEQPAARPRVPRARTRRRAVLAGAAAAVLLGGGLVWTVSGPTAPEGYAATPELLHIVSPQQSRSGEAILRELAQRAADSGIPAGTAGQIGYIKTKNWYLHSQIDRSGTISAVQPEVRESWRHPDGSGRAVTSRGTPEFRSQSDREHWAGDTSGSKRAYRWGTGERASYRDERPPTDADALRQWLRQQPSGQSEPLRTLTAITDLLRNRVLLPDERATVLRVLADLPGLHYDGTTHDRAGRPGQAFSLESDGSGLPTRYTFIIDPDNGRFLGYEEMLTTSAGKLNVPIPSVISYTVYLERKFITRQ